MGHGDGDRHVRESTLGSVPTHTHGVLSLDSELGERADQLAVPAPGKGAVHAGAERVTPKVTGHPEQSLRSRVGDDDDVGFDRSAVSMMPTTVAIRRRQ